MGPLSVPASHYPTTTRSAEEVSHLANRPISPTPQSDIEHADVHSNRLPTRAPMCRYRAVCGMSVIAPDQVICAMGRLGGLVTVRRSAVRAIRSRGWVLVLLWLRGRWGRWGR
jgi:hypothetical protein